MKLTPLHDPKDGQLRIAGLMSLSGSNLRKIIEHENSLSATPKGSPFTVCCIVSDAETSSAVEIGKDYARPVFSNDVFAYYRARGKPLKDMDVRSEFDGETKRFLDLYGVKCAAFAGYMRIATDVLTRNFISVNVHPGDLSVMDGGIRKYTGDDAVEKALRDGAEELRSSTILLESAVTAGRLNPLRIDSGKIFMISQPTEVQLYIEPEQMKKDELKKVIDKHQGRLKEVGDWKIFPLTLQYIAEGRYQKDEKGNLYFEGEPVPSGVRL